MVHLSTASTLFLEKGLAPQSIFTLLLNAVERESMHMHYMAMWLMSSDTLGDSYSMMQRATLSSLSNIQRDAICKITKATESFSPDLERAQARIVQFVEDHKQLKAIKSQLTMFTVWQILFSKRQAYKNLLLEQEKLENMKICISELVNIAYFKYYQTTGHDSKSFLLELSEFFNKESQKFQSI